MPSIFNMHGQMRGVFWIFTMIEIKMLKNNGASRELQRVVRLKDLAIGKV